MKFCMLFQVLQLFTELSEKNPKNKKLSGMKSLKSNKKEVSFVAALKEMLPSKKWVSSKAMLTLS